MHILFDDEYFVTVDEDFIYSCGYRNGDEINGAELAAFREAAGLRSAFVVAMRLISMRDYGEKELENKLTEKGCQRCYAQAAAEKAKAIGYIDDESYAVALAQRLAESKGYSSSKIKYELVSKGISREIADNAAQMIDNEPILRIIELLNSKFSRNLNDEKGIRRTVAALQRLGYRYSDIRSALRQREILSEPEDF